MPYSCAEQPLHGRVAMENAVPPQPCCRARASTLPPPCHHGTEQQRSKECPEITAPAPRTPFCHFARGRAPFCQGLILDAPCRRGTPSPDLSRAVRA